jgi:hypothetical protein
MLRRVALVRTEVSEEFSASFIRVTRIGELGMLAVTSNLQTLRLVFTRMIYGGSAPYPDQKLKMSKVLKDSGEHGAGIYNSSANITVWTMNGPPGHESEQCNPLCVQY